MNRHFVKLVVFSSVLLLAATVQAEEPLVVNIKASKHKASPNEAAPKSPDRSPALPVDGGDFLKQLNGVSGSRFGGRGIDPVIRGQSQTQLNVLLDGAYLHGGCPNRMDPPASYAALETYEKVTVEKGVQTLQHGGGGSGGTVLFERDTRSITNPDGGIAGKLSATTSSNGIKHDLAADLNASSAKGYVRLFAQDRQADSYKDGNGNTVRSAYKHKQGGIVLGATPTADRLFEYSYENNDFSDAMYPGAGMDSPTEKGEIQRLKYKDKFDGAVKSVDAEAYISDVSHLMDNYSLRTPAPVTKMSVPTTSKTTGGNLALKSNTGNTDITYGVNVQNRARNATMKNITAGTDVSLMWPNAHTDQTGIFAEAETKLGATNKLKYGLRVDQVNASAANANTVVNGAPPANNTANKNYNIVYGYGATDKKETNVGGLLRYEKAMNDTTTVFTGVSHSVRTADETERYLNNFSAGKPAWTGNPNIKPEKHNQLDLGISQQQGKVHWTGTLFADKVNDFILRDTANKQAGILTTGGTIYRNVNADITGLELSTDTKLTDKLTLSGDLAHVHRTNTTDGRPISQTPADNGKVQLDYNGTKWGGGARVRFAAGQDRIDPISVASGLEAGASSGYGVVDAYGRYKISKSTKIRFGVDNVLDKAYADSVNRRNTDPLTTATELRVNEPGRAAWLKLETEF